MRIIRLIAAVILASAFLDRALGQTAPIITPTTIATQPVEMDQKTLARIYAAELGDRFNPANLDALYRAHRLLEDFFAKPADRKAIVAALEATGIDANVLGRLARIRMHWPELAGGVYYINEKTGPHTVRYFVGLPKIYDRARAWPLVIKLPTAEPFVKDPPPPADVVMLWYRDWMSQELERHPDAIVLMPLLNLDELYGPSYAGMNTVIQPLFHAADRLNLDPTRIYLVGHSMAAHAVWNLALHYPTYFAAINPLAGGASQEFQRVRVMNLRNLLPVVWHDSTDTVVKVEASRALVRILKTQKCDVDFDETHGVGHTPTEEIIERGYAKMRARSRELYPKRISLQSDRPDSIFNRNDWVQMYQPIRPGDEKWLLFSRGRGHLIVYENTFKVDASLTAPNHIEATTDNVASLRFYLNDQMVDFRKPVTVKLNRKSSFEGMVTPSVREMLNDQLYLGRGWRYYSGVIDIDLLPLPTTRPATTSKNAADK